MAWPADDNLFAMRTLGQEHPIVRTPFDEAVEDFEQVTHESRQEARGYITQLGKLFTAGDILDIVKAPDGVRLVFSAKTSARVARGEWHIPIDRRTGLPRAEARDSRQRIREQAKFAPMGSAGERAIRGVVVAAHVLGALDLMVELARLGEGIRRLAERMDADRRGEVRGVYQTMQRALVDGDQERRRRLMEQCGTLLDRLQGRFLEVARARLLAIRDPLAISFPQAVITTKEGMRRDLTSEIATALGDMRLAEFCATLNLEAQREVGNELASHIIVESLRTAYGPLLDLLTSRARYVDLNLADEATRKAAVLRDPTYKLQEGVADDAP